jgi:hypothetical protein
MLALAHAALFLAGVVVTTPPASAQGPAASASLAAIPSSLGAPGVMALGFAIAGEPIHAFPRTEGGSILPAGSRIPDEAQPLVELMWRTSATFRRQCARLAQAGATVTLTISPRMAGTNHGESEIRRKAGLRADVQLRGADPASAEYLAHEIEHVVEQIDGIDLRLAVAGRVHGVRRGMCRETYETARAIAVGRIVAREVDEFQDRR